MNDKRPIFDMVVETLPEDTVMLKYMAASCYLALVALASGKDVDQNLMVSDILDILNEVANERGL